MNINLNEVLPVIGGLKRATGKIYGDLYVERLGDGSGRVTTVMRVSVDLRNIASPYEDTVGIDDIEHADLIIGYHAKAMAGGNGQLDQETFVVEIPEEVVDCYLTVEAKGWGNQ